MEFFLCVYSSSNEDLTSWHKPKYCLHLLHSKLKYQVQGHLLHIMKSCYVKTQGSAWKELYESVRHSVQWTRSRKGTLLFIWLSSQLRGDKPAHSHGGEGRSVRLYWGDGEVRASVMGLGEGALPCKSAAEDLPGLEMTWSGSHVTDVLWPLWNG